MIRKKQDLTSEPEKTKRSCINICIIIPTLSILGKCLDKVKNHMLAERVKRVSIRHHCYHLHFVNVDKYIMV